MADRFATTSAFRSERAALDACVTKRRKNALLTLLATPASIYAWERLRGRGTSKVRGRIIGQLATTTTIAALYELATARYRKGLSDEVPAPASDGLSDIELRDLGHYVLAASVTGLAKTAIQKRSPRAVARQAAIYAAIWGSLVGLFAGLRRAAAHERARAERLRLELAEWEARWEADAASGGVDF